MTTGFDARLRDTRKDDDALAACTDRVVKQLEETSTTGDRPGILLGKIQSGKTRAFVGVIARACDRGFDVAVVFTKGTTTLSAQTVARLGSDLGNLSTKMKSWFLTSCSGLGSSPRANSGASL